MCGICGIAFDDPGRVPETGLVEGMCETLRHRGPDGGGLHRGPGAGLGVRRLSIVDPHHGGQPFYNERRTIALVCNGEIYNAPELRSELERQGHTFVSRCDVEVMVHLYERDGAEFLHRLRGMFAFALWDMSRRKLILGRDRFGIKPLYYARAPGGICFASEMKAIRRSGLIPVEIAPRAIADLLEFGYVLAPHSVFRGTRQIRPGHYVTFEQGRTTIRRYWRPLSGVRRPVGSREEWTEALVAKLRETLRIHLRSDVPVGAWLSGGLDSSMIVALMAEERGGPVDTFSLDFATRRHDEIRCQETLVDSSRYVRTNQRVSIRKKHFEQLPDAVRRCENMSSTAIEVLQLALARATSRRFKVALSGEGADEVFGGYAYYWADPLLRPLGRLPGWLKRLALFGGVVQNRHPYLSRIHLSAARMNLERFRALSAPPAPPLGQLLSPGLHSVVKDIDRADVTGGLPSDFDRWHPFRQLQYFDITVRLPSFVLRMADHDGMAHSVEVRVPFLDHELVELCAQMPAGLQRRGRRRKFMLREAARDLLPRDIVHRPKRSLKAPCREWLRGELPDFARQMLSERALRKAGFFRPGAVGQLLQRHRAGEHGLARTLMGCLVVQLWDDILVGT